jgi:hypothetical protein
MELTKAKPEILQNMQLLKDGGAGISNAKWAQEGSFAFY